MVAAADDELTAAEETGGQPYCWAAEAEPTTAARANVVDFIANVVVVRVLGSGRRKEMVLRAGLLVMVEKKSAMSVTVPL